ncbi:uncharacterized protein An03g04780 [Aspergillus niger]|uniref:Contig An03c0130, genomic contig n=2 Tax=Aspergillus niger TaxID=5061 RepID=A2QGX0_ASPNC|nr:uncharacterized protein An03g04780 [Aspergillus niger]CAK38270.1 unnamed protein product [Aspergillus niger]
MMREVCGPEDTHILSIRACRFEGRRARTSDVLTLTSLTTPYSVRLRSAGPPDGYFPPPTRLSALAISPASASSILSEHVIVRLIYSLSDTHSPTSLLSDTLPTSFSVFLVLPLHIPYQIHYDLHPRPDRRQVFLQATIWEPSRLPLTFTAGTNTLVPSKSQ